jgi:hypothetical protein
MYKVKKQKKALVNTNSIQDLNDIFNQLLGETKILNLDIIYPKYKVLYELYEKSHKLLDMLRNNMVIKHKVNLNLLLGDNLEITSSYHLISNWV